MNFIPLSMQRIAAQQLSYFGDREVKVLNAELAVDIDAAFFYLQLVDVIFVDGDQGAGSAFFSREKIVKKSHYIIAVAIVVVFAIIWRSGNYSEEFVLGKYQGIAIGDNKQSVAAFLREGGPVGFHFITLEGRNNFQVESISSGTREDWYKNDIWTLTEFNDGSYLKGIRIVFKQNQVIKIEVWSRWFEYP